MPKWENDFESDDTELDDQDDIDRDEDW